MSTTIPEPDKRPLENMAVPQQSTLSAVANDSDEHVTIHVGALAYLRTMWSLLWTAFRHPLSTSYIDVATGEVVEPTDEDEI